MRAILTPDIAPHMGVVLFRPGAEIMSLFRQGRVLIENVPERLQALPSGLVPAVAQPLASDPVLTPFLINEQVIAAAGGLVGLEYHLELIGGPCQWPQDKYHDHNMTIMRHAPGAIRLCWACDNELREQTTSQIEALATRNLCEWIVEQVRRALGFDESHVVTLPELCWWAARREVVEALPEGMARKALSMPKEVVRGAGRESALVPSVPATSIVQQLAKPIMKLAVDPESPESFMKRPKRRRWENEKYTRWVKQQQCACCSNPADDPHHLIGYGMGGMGTKAHDLFVIPLCRRHHDELHADTVAFEKKHGSQPELLLKQLDRALAIGALA
ncbi:DUF968 domain-containing protein [Cedecea neteri]|uniref:DUF968 domain-containing protein n=1 Tax=Cedecea neteri TaxID=158822 RepID=UPI002AA7C911|nr:DUF968 domain-containing protein [Cedecea neteri]WPU24492.1 DUF968 domain-containing protein [Cedecea neteri]